MQSPPPFQNSNAHTDWSKRHRATTRYVFALVWRYSSTTDVPWPAGTHDCFYLFIFRGCDVFRGRHGGKKKGKNI